MNAVISGRAGLALLIEGESMMSLDVDDLETLVPRSPHDLRFLLADADDLITLENTRREEVAQRLELEHDIAGALDMTLIALDSGASMELRVEAVAALDELLAGARVVERLESTMYAKPLPGSADLIGALFCTDVKTTARSFFERLSRYQPAIRSVREAWEALPDHLFSNEQNSKDLFHDMACNEGLFRLLALSYDDQAKGSEFVTEALQNRSISRLRNHRDVIQRWSAAVIEGEYNGSKPSGPRARPQAQPHLLSEKPPHVIRKTVLLVDDHALVRAGVRALIEETLPEVKVIGEAKDGREALRLVGEHNPDLVLMDIAMPGLNGIEATARVSKEFPNVQVIILSMYANEEYVLEAIQAGAAGYLVKRSAGVELEKAIKTVAGGDSYFSPRVLEHVTKVGSAHTVRNLIDRLTSRQSEILQLIAERHSTKEIAQVLSISVKTVETHRAQLMDRLGVYDVSGLVRFAIQAGIVPLEE